MIVEDYPPIPGGDGIYVREISRTLVKRGDEVHVVTRGYSRGVTIEHVGYTIHRICKYFEPSLLTRSLLMLMFALYTFRLNKRERFDVIHAQGDLPALAASLCSKLHGTPVVLTIHGTWPSWLLRMTSRWGSIFSALEDYILARRGYAAVIAVDSYSFSVVKRNLKVKKVFQIPNGVNLKQYSRAPDERRFHELLNVHPKQIAGAKRILFVGRLIAQKAPEHLVRAFAQVSKEVNTILIIVGGGELRERVENEMKKSSIESRVFLLSGISDDDLINLYLCSDIFALSSRWEGFPLVVVEAMACGKPIIATRVGGVPDIVNKDVGILVEPGDIAGLGNALLKLLRDEKLRAKLSRNCKERSKNYDWRVIAEQTCRVYESVL